MKFIYEYKTKENEQRSGEFCAASRDDVYRELRKQGIKPYKVYLAPGLLNRIQSYGKRTAAIVVLGTLCLVLGVVVRSFQKENTALSSSLSTLNSSFENTTRRQVIGDTAVIEKGIRTGWADVFELEGERFLASFAIPGVPAGQRNTTEEEILKALEHNALAPSTKHQAPGTESDGIEARQIRAMVEGMKEELRNFLQNGGTIKVFGNCLVERQETELGYYNRTKSELETMKNSGMDAKALEALWEKRNNELRQMGVKLVPMPE